MRYLILLYDNEESGAEHAEADMPLWFEVTRDLRASGKMLGGEALEPTATATTLRRDGEKLLTLDGPFAETKEQLGGFYMIEAGNLDEAMEWAARMPNLRHGGSVEIRPIMEFPEE